MKISTLVSTILVALWSSRVNATVNVGMMPSIVEANRTYTLYWTATVNYTYNLWLVLDDPLSNAYEWTKVQTLASGLLYNSLNGSFAWTVPTNLSANGDYGIWFGCFPIPSNGTNLYTNITNYFRVSNSSLASASSSSSAVASRTSAPTSTSSAAATSSAASHNEASSSHSTGLSGGAIAGIVIGILALIAIVIAAVLLRRHRRKKNDREQREAAARANRLDPVMKVGQSSFEMQGRGLNKETNV